MELLPWKSYTNIDSFRHNITAYDVGAGTVARRLRLEATILTHRSSARVKDVLSIKQTIWLHYSHGKNPVQVTCKNAVRAGKSRMSAL